MGWFNKKSETSSFEDDSGYPFLRIKVIEARRKTDRKCEGFPVYENVSTKEILEIKRRPGDDWYPVYKIYETIEID